MLEIINNLSPFFKDCYKEIGVREYSREVSVAPPTASKLLKEFENNGLLKSQEERRFLLFRANRESSSLKYLSIVFWGEILKSLFEHLEEQLHPDAIVLFGSLTNLEVSKKSDIDIAVLTKFKKQIDVKKLEKKFDKEIHLFVFESLEKVNKELRIGIINGQIIKGTLR